MKTLAAVAFVLLVACSPVSQETATTPQTEYTHTVYEDGPWQYDTTYTYYEYEYVGKPNKTNY